MRGICSTGVLLALLSFCQVAWAQRLYSPAATGPLSVFEYHEGTYSTEAGRVQSATFKLLSRSGSAATSAPPAAGRSARSDDEGRYTTLVVQTPTGSTKPDSVREFTFDERRFVHLDRLTQLDVDRLRTELGTEFVEVFQDSGRVELYGYYPSWGNRYVLASFTPGLIYEADLRRYYFWRRPGEPGFYLMRKLPPRGYNAAFERELRALFADRPDLLKHIDDHNIRLDDLPAAFRAYNSGLPIRFE
ncbi:MAG: hypothetical protein H7330_15585 [Hymenobacteraceae bacterium]|nr:hypothetical protein [Hymenobacteraceae bacterium]